jgi:hypothetical protein
MRYENKYTFYDFTEDKLPYRVIFVVGPSRSGKSSFARLLESLPHVFHMEENWLLLTAPVLAEKGLMSPDVFVNFYRAAIHEWIYDLLLMRSVSFRPTDASFIRGSKSDAEVDFSLNRLRDRVDVEKYVQSNSVTVVINLSEVNVHIDLLERVFPSAQIYHMLRDPQAIAHEIEAKGWHSDDALKRPANGELFANIKHRNKSFYVPSWVKEEDFVLFIEMSLAQRAAYYAFRQYFLSASVMQRSQKANVSFIFYEDFIKSPRTTLDRLFPNAKFGEKTKLLMSRLTARGNNRFESQPHAAPDFTQDWNTIYKMIPGFQEKYMTTCVRKGALG